MIAEQTDESSRNFHNSQSQVKIIEINNDREKISHAVAMIV